jgi:hypothetical protein
METGNTSKKDITIEWTSEREMPIGVIIDNLYKSFPTFNAEVYDNQNNLIVKYENISSSENVSIENYRYLKNRADILKKYRPVVFTPPRKYKEIFGIGDQIKNSFTFSIEENFNLYKQKFNKYGYFEDVHIKIYHNDIFSNKNEVNIKYDKIDINRFNAAIEKIYRSNDNLSLKIKFNQDAISDININSFLIIAEAISDKGEIRELKPILINNISDKSLSVVDQSRIITIPFYESEIIEESYYIKVRLYPLRSSDAGAATIIFNQNQSDLRKFADDFLLEKISSKNLYKNGSNIEAVSFQGYIYLFNPQSYGTIAWPQETLNINGINYTRFFVKGEVGQNKSTITYNPYNPEANIVDIILTPAINEKLGYYSLDQNNFYDFKSDLPYIKSNNINSINIINVEDINQETSISIEFITNLTEEEISINTLSSNMSFVQKYYKLINGKNYICLIFNLKYPKISENFLSSNSSLSKDQLISDKAMINFSFKLNN